MTHYPKNPHCVTCQRAKMQASPHPNRSKRESEDPTPVPKAFGDLDTCDSIGAKSDQDLGIEGNKVMLVFKDCGTKWVDAYATPTKQFEYVVEAMLMMCRSHYSPGSLKSLKL